MHAAPANQPVPAIFERVFLWCSRCTDLCLPFAPVKTKPPIDRTPNSIGCFKPAPLPHTAASGAQDYAPLRPGDLPQPVLRPGALDHTKIGSKQADGSVRPYRPPTFGCVGKLASSSQKLDATIIKQHKEKRK